MGDVIETRSKAARPPRPTTPAIADVELRPLAEAALAALQVTAEAAIARRVRPEEFAESTRQANGFERAVATQLDRYPRAAHTRAVERALESLRAPREERRRRYGELGDVDVRSDGADALLERMPAAPVAHVASAAARLVDTNRAAATGGASGGGAKALASSSVAAGQGAVAKKYEKFKQQLGPKVGSERVVKDVRGRGVLVQFCERGVVELGPKPEAFAVTEPIWSKYEALGGVEKFPGGPPVSDTETPPDGGALNHFHDNYSILKGPGLAPYEVHGVIRQRYADLGFQKHVGYPVTDESSAGDLIGRFSRFTNGAIVWHPARGAHWVPEPLIKAWGEAGSMHGTLGYPIAPCSGNPNVQAVMAFEGGTIVKQAPQLPATPMFPLKAVELDLEKVRLQRKTDEGQMNDELYVTGAYIDLDGNSVAVPSIYLGKFKNDQHMNVDKTFAKWDLVERKFPGCPLTLVSTVGFWEDDPGGGGSEFAEKLLDGLKKAVEAAVKKGIEKLGEVVSAAAKSKLLGMLVGFVVGAIASWVLSKFWEWVEKLVEDDVFTVFPVTWTLKDVHSAPAGTNLSPELEFRTEEANPDYGKPGIVRSAWRFQRA